MHLWIVFYISKSHIYTQIIFMFTQIIMRHIYAHIFETSSGCNRLFSSTFEASCSSSQTSLLFPITPKGDIVHAHAPKSPPLSVFTCARSLWLVWDFPRLFQTNKRHGAELTLHPAKYPAAERMDSAAVLLLLTVTAGTLLHGKAR